MSSNVVYLITGANRGIGLGLVAQLLKRPNTTVIATTRSSSTSTTELSDLSAAAGSRLMITTFSATANNSAATMIEDLSKQGITYIDVIIANAGSGRTFQSCIDTPMEELRTSFEVNSLGPIRLFQATFPLLQNSKEPKFILVSSSLGSIGDMETDLPTLAYGISKAAANYFVKKVHFEHENVVALAVHPGWVKTGMGQGFADALGVKDPKDDFDECVLGVLKQIDRASRSTTSGRFVSYDDEIIAW